MNILAYRANRSGLAAAVLILTTLAAHAAAPQLPSAAPAVLQSAGVPAPSGGVTAPAADIHDIRGPKPITSAWMLSLVTAAALLTAGGACAAWVWNRRRSREASKGPLDIALERLEKARQLMALARGREFSIEVSGAVRNYIETRFNLLATHLTTDEFLRQLLEPAGSLLAAHRSLLEHFLQTCDLAKFGGWNLAASDIEAMLQSAHRFIVESAADSGPYGMRPARTAAVDQPLTSASRETYVSLPST